MRLPSFVKEDDKTQVPLKPDPALGDNTQNTLLYHRRHLHHIANSNSINTDDDDNNNKVCE